MSFRAIITDERIGITALIALVGVVIWSLLQFNLQYEVSRMEQRDREYEAHDEAAIKDVEARHLRELRELDDRITKRLGELQVGLEGSYPILMNNQRQLSEMQKGIIENQKQIIEMIRGRK